MSMMSLAGRPGTEVEPMWSIRWASSPKCPAIACAVFSYCAGQLSSGRTMTIPVMARSSQQCGRSDRLDPERAAGKQLSGLVRRPLDGLPFVEESTDHPDAQEFADEPGAEAAAGPVFEDLGQSAEQLAQPPHQPDALANTHVRRHLAETQLLGDILASDCRVVVLDDVLGCDRTVGEHPDDDRRTVGVRVDAVLAADRADHHRLHCRTQSVRHRQAVRGGTAEPGETGDHCGESTQSLDPPVAALGQWQRRPFRVTRHLHLEQAIDREDQSLLGQIGLLLGGVLSQQSVDAERVLAAERVEYEIDAELDPADREDDGGIWYVGTVCHARKGRESMVHDGCRSSPGVSVAIRTGVRDSLVS